MIITRTVNADKRYYLDEENIVNLDSIIDTVSRFNNMKIQLYNVLYDKKYRNAGPLVSKTYSAWLKETFGTNDYYNCAVYTYASGALSSQKELKSLYERTKAEDLKARDAKIEATQRTLDNKRKLKESIRIYIKTGRWQTPYFGCRFKVSGKNITPPSGKTVDIGSYERKLESEIRKRKTRLALIKESRKRAAAKLESLKNHNPRRIIFGTRSLYQKKDDPDTNMAFWRDEFHDARHASMSLPGRHTSKDCNFLVRNGAGGLAVKCMDGREAVFLDFKLARYNDEWNNMLKAPKSERKAICYNFSIRKDANGRKYMIVSVTLELENSRCNEFFGNGCVSMDINYDHVAISEIDRCGNRVGGETFWFDPQLKTSGQISEEIGRIMAKVGRYCTDKKKPLIMEDIDTTISKSGLRYGNSKRNAHAFLFAYHKMTACIENQSYKQGFGIRKINPAYTSQIGKFLYMRKFGISIHEAASYTVGLKGMEFVDKLMPDKRLIELLPAKIKASVMNDPDIFSVMNAWKKIAAAFHGIPAHCFFRELPYDALDQDAHKMKKHKTLKMLADEMKICMQL
ncbi:MAG: hypothetical protein ACI4GE_04055 [Lachnospiraceae bacterium]